MRLVAQQCGLRFVGPVRRVVCKIVRERREIVVAMDWTDVKPYNQSLLTLWRSKGNIAAALLAPP